MTVYTLGPTEEERLRTISVLFGIKEDQVLRISLWIVEHIAKRYFKDYYELGISRESIEKSIKECNKG